jgi:type II secretory pathway predicted ATPase ExeA
MKYFNTTGPCRSEIHYMLPAVPRLPEMRGLIESQSYFVLHAARQSGKTTSMIALARELTAEGRYAAIVLSVQPAATFSHDVNQAEKLLLDAWRDTAEDELPTELRPPKWRKTEAGQRIRAALRAWARAIPRPLVVFLDEIDSLKDDLLLSLLHQLRDGFTYRPKNFPWSLALVGMRDIQDYKIRSGGSERLNTASPFNILTRSLTIGNFTAEEVAALYRQHTSETGQVFTADAAQLAFDLTQGQPYLVNALAKVAVEELQPDAARAITAAEIRKSKDVLIERRSTHLRSLVERLREPRVRSVIEPILAGNTLGDLPTDDLQFVLDLGLIRRSNGNGVFIANPIYHEIIPTALSDITRASLPQLAPVWLNADGTLDPNKLLESFLAFWRQHGQPLLGSVHYHEIAPHIVLLAFLHRVANSGGTIEREYAIGTRRMDVCLRYGNVTLGLELKVWRDGRPDPLKEGLTQLDDYLNGLGLDTGWLVIFDQRSGLPDISERTTTEAATSPAGRTITVIRG